MKNLEEWVEKLRNSGVLILVEGKKDKAALESFGIKNVETLEKRPIYKVVEDVSKKTKDCIILMDLDKEGRKLFGKLNSGLARFGVRVDNRFREFLFKETKLRQIEGLVSYILRL